MMKSRIQPTMSKSHPVGRRARVSAFLMATLLLTGFITVLAPAAHSAVAGELADYPEYPYAATDYTEPFRGQFHFSPQNGFMNDINAPVYYRGVYHLFFQHNPHGLGWDTIHWGHATSADLVHWTQQPIALEPGVAAGNLWSGSGWVDVDNVTGLKTGDDDPILLFTNTEGVSIAYSTDGAKTFQMYNGGAKVITNPVESRDPKVQWDPQHSRWEMVTFQAGTGAVFYTSTNLLDWTLRGSYAAPWFVECPDLYRLPVDGDDSVQKWVLQSAGGKYVIGALNAAGVFVSDWTEPQRMDGGITNGAFAPNTWYASQTFNQLPSPRVVQIGWQPSNAGVTWTGNASFPVELALRTYPEGIRLTRNPVSEIAGIRSSTASWGARTVTDDPSTDPLAGVSADTYEINAVFDTSTTSAMEFGFRLHAAPDGSSDRTVAYSMSARTLYGQSMPPIADRVTIRILVDRGQLEVFGNDGKTVISDNVAFDSSPDSLGVDLYSSGGSVSLVSLTLSLIGSTWTPAPDGRAPRNAIVSTTHQNMCIDRDTASGRVQVWTCLGNAQQSWTLDDLGQLKTDDVCAGIPAGHTGNMSLVEAAPCSGGAHQAWRHGNFGALINLASGRCLDIPSANFSDGIQLQVYDCVGTANQSWVGPAYLSASGRITWNASSSCLDRDIATGRLQIWTCNGLDNQTWTFNGDGTVTSGGDCMQLSPDDDANGARVAVAPCQYNSRHQQWAHTANGALRNIGAGRCLDLDSADMTNGRQLIVWDCLGNANQTWIGPASDSS